MSKSYMVLVRKVVPQEQLVRVSNVVFNFEYPTTAHILKMVLLDLDVLPWLREQQERSGEEILVYPMRTFTDLLNNGKDFRDYWLVPFEARLTLSRKAKIPHGTAFAKSFLRSIAPEYLQTLTTEQKMALWNYYMQGKGKIWYKTDHSEILQELLWLPYLQDISKDERDNPLYTWYDGRTLRRVTHFSDTPWRNAEAADWIVEQEDCLFLLWAENKYGFGAGITEVEVGRDGNDE